MSLTCHFAEGLKNARGGRGTAGFTLIEYMVVLSLSLLLVVIAVPNFAALDASFRRMQGRSQLEGDIIYVRSLALREGGRVAIVPSEDGSAYTINAGHAPYLEFPGTDTRLEVRSFPAGVTLVSHEPIVFDSKGHSIDENGSMISVSLVLTWKTKPFATISVCPMGFVL